MSPIDDLAKRRGKDGEPLRSEKKRSREGECDGDLDLSRCFLRKLREFKRTNLHVFFTKEREAQNLIGWQEKLILGVGTLFSCMVVSMMLIISASISVSKAPTWALTEVNRHFLEAWRTIDGAYIDKSFNGQSWFRYREHALCTEPMNNREETCMF